MKRRVQKLTRLLGVIVFATLAGLAGLAAFPAAGLEPGPWSSPFLVGGVAVAGGTALWLMHGVFSQHFEDLKLLDVALRATARGEVPPEQLQTRWSGAELDEVGDLARQVSEIASRRAMEAARPDQRLAAVIGALGDAVVVVTETGQISLVNSAAKGLLGDTRVAVGTSIYAALDRGALAAAMAAAQAAGRRPVDVMIETVEGETLHARITDFGQHRGSVLAIPASEVEHYHEVEHALDLHDVPPPAEPVGFETPLDRLPGFVFDTETTGLDVGRDVVVSVGAVRTHGAKVYPGLTIDRLVNPGRPIPARSTAVHGITSAMVAEAPPIRDVLPLIRAMMADCVLIGHNTGFDIAMLRRAIEAEGQVWHDPPWLDVLLLAAALDTDETDFNLESMALRMGVNVSGRHTALGDSLVTAEVFVRMLPALAKAGVKTFGDAVEFSQRATRVIARQREAGW